MRYFRKEIPNNPARLPNGLILKGEVFAFDHPSILEGVDSMIAKQIGGFVEIDKAEYDDLLKKKEQSESQRQPGNHSRFIRQPSQQLRSKSAAAGIEPAFAQSGVQQVAPVVQAPPPEPLTVPKFKPMAGRV